MVVVLEVVKINLQHKVEAGIFKEEEEYFLEVVVRRDVHFVEDECWNWGVTNSSVEKIIYKDGVMGKTVSIGMSGSNQSRVSSTDTLSGHVTDGNTALETQLFQFTKVITNYSPIERVRTLRNIYENYTFALIISDSVTFEEGEKSKS